MIFFADASSEAVFWYRKAATRSGIIVGSGHRGYVHRVQD